MKFISFSRFVFKLFRYLVYVIGFIFVNIKMKKIWDLLKLNEVVGGVYFGGKNYVYVVNLIVW